MDIKYVMTYEGYKDMLKLPGIGTPEKLIEYINETYGLLGTVVEITFDD